MIVYDPSVDAVYTFLVYTALALLGACMGSFSSAISYRVIHRESWIGVSDPLTGKIAPARSRCPQCGHVLSVLDLIPILSWVMGGGKCRYCKSRIPLRYPLVEVAGAILLCLFFSIGGDADWQLLAFLLMLPFFLSFFGVVLQKSRPPLYLWGGAVGAGLLFLFCFVSS